MNCQVFLKRSLNQRLWTMLSTSLTNKLEAESIANSEKLITDAQICARELHNLSSAVCETAI